MSAASAHEQLHKALLQHPEYFGLPGKERPACTAFVLMAARLGGTDPPDSAEIELSYQAALEEARSLLAEGKLTGLELPRSSHDGGPALGDDADLGVAAPESTPPSSPTLEPTPTAVPEKSPEQEIRIDGRRRYTKWATLTDLRPNPVNGGVYNASLADESIARMAENQGRHGARHRIEVNENNEILDGERRWRALLRRSEIEAEVTVVVGVTEREEIEEYIVDAFDSIRETDIEEQVNLFRLAQRVLARRHGRGRGRPGKTVSNDTGFWNAKKVKEEAARMGRFTSYVTATRAAKVLAEGDDELRAALCSGEVTINAAYEQRRQSRRPTPPISNESQASLVEATPAGNCAPNAADGDLEEGGNETEDGDLEDDEDNQSEADVDDEPEDDNIVHLPGASAGGTVWRRLSEVANGVEADFERAANVDYARAVEWRDSLLATLGWILEAAEPDDEEVCADEDAEEVDLADYL